MNRSIVFYLVSRLALINGLALLIPLLSALWWGEAGLVYFAPALAAALLAAAFCRYRGRHHKRHLGPGEGAWYMVSAWFLLGLLGMIPYVMAGTFASPNGKPGHPYEGNHGIPGAAFHPDSCSSFHSSRSTPSLKASRLLRRLGRRAWLTAGPACRSRSCCGTASWNGSAASTSSSSWYRSCPRSAAVSA